MPSEPFTRDFAASGASTLLGKVDAVGRVYSVTSDATAVRAGWLNLAPWDEINEVRDAIRARSGPKAPGGGDYYRNVISR